MKITIVTGAFLPVPPGPAGAVEKIWARLAREFARRGHSVTLLSRKHKGSAGTEIVDGVRYIRKSGFTFTRRQGVNMLRDLCYTLSTIGSVPKSQITVTNTFFFPILTTLFPKRFGKTVVDLQRFPKGQLWLYSRCGRVRAPSQAILDAAILQYPSGGHMLKTIPNPVDVNTFFPPASPRTPAVQGAILYTGRINPEKGIHLLIQAFRIIHSEFPRTRLILVGPRETNVGGGGPAYMHELNQLASGLPVEFRPPIVDPEKLAKELSAASLYCYPSLAEKGESFGVAPLEAMATGLAVVVSNLSVFRDFIEEGETGLVFDHRASNPERELAAKLRILLTDDRLRNKIERQAALRARHFGYEQVADALLNDFDHLTQTANT